MKYRRMPIEIESPEQMGYDNVKFNLTESSVTDRHLQELLENIEDFPLSYGDHLGLPEFREILVSGHQGLSPNNVITTTGAASALFIVATSLLSAEEHCIVVNPNYITNIETPRLLNVNVSYYNLRFENEYEIDLQELEDMFTSETKLLSLTYPHNPTGKCLSEEKLRALIKLAEKYNCYFLLDETYRDMQFGTVPPLAATMSDYCISVSSLSKTYGLPGIRSGWIITKFPHLIESFLAAKEQIFVTGSLLDEYLSFKFLNRKDKVLPNVHKHILHNRALVEEWINNSEFFEWVKPEGGCVCFPRVRKSINTDMTTFYKILNEKYKTYVGPGHWFESPPEHFRLGFGYPLEEELEQGLLNLESAMKSTLSS